MVTAAPAVATVCYIALNEHVILVTIQQHAFPIRRLSETFCSLLPQWASGVSLPDIHKFLAHCDVVVALRISAFVFFVACTKFCAL